MANFYTALLGINVRTSRMRNSPMFFMRDDRWTTLRPPGANMASSTGLFGRSVLGPLRGSLIDVLAGIPHAVLALPEFPILAGALESARFARRERPWQVPESNRRSDETFGESAKQLEPEKEYEGREERREQQQ